MKTTKLAALAAFILTYGIAAFGADYVPGEVIVKYKDGSNRSRVMMNDLYDAVGVKSVTRFKGMMKGFEKLVIAENIKVEDAIFELQQNPAVEYAQPNYILRAPVLKSSPDDGVAPSQGIPCIPGFEIPGCDPTMCIIPGFPFPPGCTDEGGGGGGTPGDRPEVAPPPAEVLPPVVDPALNEAYGLEKIQATEAWKQFRGSKNIIVADIDTGVDYNHEDLSFNMWRNPNIGEEKDEVGFDFIHNDGLPFDDQGHGTHTSGTIGAVGGNGIGISGVSQYVSIMAVKFLSAEGSGTTEGAIQGIDYAISKGAKILSNSWGGPADGDNKALYEAIERAREKDVLFIAAAGNDGVNNDTSPKKSYPAAYDNDNLISVAATDANDGIAYFSNFGVKTTHVAAPGVDVYSTIPGGKYTKHSGTSMACPHVAGAAALIWANNPHWNYKQVKNALMKSVDPLPALKGKVATGGRINVLKALRSTE